MRTIKIGSTGSEVKRLCELLDIEPKLTFDESLDSIVKAWQESHGLVSDGIVGSKTWLKLFSSNRSGVIVEKDYEWAAEYLGVEKAALKAVIAVETGMRGGFIVEGKPRILFEGHIFWKRLIAHKINPIPWSKKYPKIVYKNWTKLYYAGGAKEYERLAIAAKINRESALESISMGLFQIMGMNYKLCSCSSVEEMWNLMCKDEVSQFILGIEFLRNGGYIPYLVKKDWRGLARKYNGSGQVDVYSKKLLSAYRVYSSK